MARFPRLVIPGQPMHVVQRGNNRQATFFADEDYRVYLDAIEKAIEKYPVDIHAYVLMTNHVHLLLTPHKEIALSRFIQAVGRRYVRYVNGVYKRSGTLWEGRYKSAIIDTDEYLLKCYRYVEMNPVRAGMVERPNEYQWSSFHRNALGKESCVIKSHQQYKMLGDTEIGRQEVYLSFFSNYLSADDVAVIREGTIKTSIIGHSRFSEEVEQMLDRRVILCSYGGDRRSKDFEVNK
jgi:REP-associated tyrosine transposase